MLKKKLVSVCQKTYTSTVMSSDVKSVLEGLQERVASLELPSVSVSDPVTTTTSTSDFLRMDNPWMWVLIVGAMVVVFGVWWIMSKNKNSNDSNDSDDDESPRQTTPRREYAKHYGSATFN